MVNAGNREKANIIQIKNVPIINRFREERVEVVSIKQEQQNFIYKSQETDAGN